jgi:hypothetical protein
MCLEYEWEYMQIRAEEARKLAKKIEDDLRKKPKPTAPATVTPAQAGAEAQPQDTEPVPV